MNDRDDPGDGLSAPGSAAGTAERRAWTSKAVLELGSIGIDEIVRRFGVSRMTVHRDLDELERQGVLRKVRNGASAQPSMLFESEIRYRAIHQVAEKEDIARVALEAIEPGDSLILDESTTLLPFARALAQLESITVITNFRRIIDIVAQSRDVKLIALGGLYDARYDTFTGPSCRDQVAQLRADVYVTSTTAIEDGTAYHPDAQIVSVKHAMYASASRRILLVDHTKFGHAALHRFADLKAFDCVIVDAGLDVATVARLRSQGIDLRLAGPSGVDAVQSNVPSLK
ncbi:MAG: DeoR/GlpR transcriptional regulator [Candidatus Eremiobacteraeota bacterium]|nr:DeoR/GlpR transcriptional regulator [Candidatus Eremiobacteraeota bacterium]